MEAQKSPGGSAEIIIPDLRFSNRAMNINTGYWHKNRQTSRPKEQNAGPRSKPTKFQPSNFKQTCQEYELERRQLLYQIVPEKQDCHH